MLQSKNEVPRNLKLALYGLVIAALLVVGSTLGLSANKPETIDATAMGTGTQMGEHINITLNIYDYSSQ
jgi:hypothetical protein